MILFNFFKCSSKNKFKKNELIKNSVFGTVVSVGFKYGTSHFKTEHITFALVIFEYTAGIFITYAIMYNIGVFFLQSVERLFKKELNI